MVNSPPRIYFPHGSGQWASDLQSLTLLADALKPIGLLLISAPIASSYLLARYGEYWRCFDVLRRFMAASYKRPRYVLHYAVDLPAWLLVEKRTLRLKPKTAGGS